MISTSNLTSKDYFRQNTAKIDWRLDSILSEIVRWVNRSGKDDVTVAVIEAAEVSHKTVSWLKLALKEIFPDKRFMFKEVPFCSSFAVHEHHAKNISCAPCDFFLDPLILKDLDLKSDVVVNIFVLHEFLNKGTPDNIFVAIENIRKYILNPKGLLLLADGIQPFDKENKSQKVTIMVKNELVGKLIEVMKSPEYKYLPTKFEGVGSNITAGDKVTLTLDQLSALILSSKYILNAFFENDAFIKKLETIAKKLKLSGHEKLVEIIATDKNLRQKLKIYFKEDEMSRIERLNNFGTTSLFMDRWQNFERFKKFYYFSYNEWSEFMKVLGFKQVKISLIESEEVNISLDLLMEPLKRDTFVYGSVKRGIPFGHCIISAF